ncbi:restriction endonuclease subunit S [[Kitasatospora] papulosa]|uniref:restriction endonuclease subunit S n=1 Tax=[Kitasatospora] papulosa TaxID=1464011 RepID=UPI00403C7A4A
MTSIPWLGEVWYPVAAAKHAFDITLGKMHQAASSSEADTEVPYFKSVSIQWKGVQRDPNIRMWATRTEISELTVQPGDLLICEGGDVGRAAIYDGPEGFIFEKSVHRARPVDSSDTRYLGYVVRSLHSSEWLDVLCNKATIRHLTGEKLGALEIPVPPPDEQRRIADFLDVETARIDELIRLRRQHVALVNERWESVIHRELSRPESDPVELRRLGASVTTGPFGTVFNASEYLHGGIPMVNPLHIKDGRIHPDEHHRVSPATATRLSRHQLKSGDLVVGRKGDLGRAALVGGEQDGWVCGSDCIAVHPSKGLRPQFLAYVLRSRYVREQLLARSLAATMPSLNEGNLLSLRVPNYTTAMQDKVTARLAAEHNWHDRIVAVMSRQLDLLTERRQALITAAVTGQFDVSTASGRNVTDGVHA